MPEPPEGEAALARLAGRFHLAETQIREMVAEAALGGDRQRLLTEALAILVALRQEDLRQPVVAAYIAAFREVRRGGDLREPKDLVASLHQKLDRGARTASESARDAFRRVKADNVDEMGTAAVIAHVDDRGTSWSLSRWSDMTTQTIGRQASSRGLSHALGDGGRVTISVGQCKWCQSHGGEGTIGEIALPPFHPSCTCAATAA